MRYGQLLCSNLHASFKQTLFFIFFITVFYSLYIGCIDLAHIVFAFVHLLYFLCCIWVHVKSICDRDSFLMYTMFS